MSSKAFVKDLLGELPYSVELYWLLRHRGRKLRSRFNLELLANRLPEMVAQVAPHARTAPSGRKLFFFASLHFWIQHAVVTGLALRGLGHNVTLGYFPYSDFAKPINRFDLRRQDLYAKSVLAGSHPLLDTASFFDMKRASKIPAELMRSVEEVTLFDTQYILQREDVSGNEPVHRLRMERNLEAAQKAYANFQQKRPDVVIIPNGMIQEFGAVYEAARSLEIPVVTYEFGEMNQRTWIGHNQKVMYHLGADDVWNVRKTRKLNSDQRAQLETFLSARQKRQPGDEFAHLWQKADREGGAKIRLSLGLDDRPVILLPTNVLGDSATLGRTIFSKSMGEWIERTLPVLAQKTNIQLVVRLHPAESNTIGPSIVELIRRVLPELPAHIHVIGPSEKVNTYDLMDIADLALVYTTNAGLEMALRGIPALVSGRAHYRDRGFTIDAETWEDYFHKLEWVLADLPSHRLTPAELEQAWNFAYSYYFEYPRPFPWHIEKLRPDLDKYPLEYVLSPEGKAVFEGTLREFAGEPPDWEPL